MNFVVFESPTVKPEFHFFCVAKALEWLVSWMFSD